MAATLASNGHVLFTVEQIELIRRLRNSGITKDQLVLAFDSLDRLDRELGPVYTIPISQAFTQQLFARQVLAAATAVPPAGQVIQQPPQQPAQQEAHQPQAPIVVSAIPPIQNSPPNNINDNTPTPTKIESDEVNGEKEEEMKLPLLNIEPPPNSLIPIGELLLNPVDEIKDDNEEFLAFAAQGEPACCDQIRAYVAKYNIRQQQIATLSRISQSYVSRFLKGDFFDMSERSRRAIKKWYIAYRNNPAIIAMAVNLVLLSHGAQNGTTSASGSPQQTPNPKMTISAMDMQPTPPAAEFLNQRRRERFVFRPNHLEILEKNFQEDSYPSFEKREEMARACNTATESLTGRPLGEKEIVTAQIVSNWFANKRKEMKKLAREEGLDLSQVPLRARGRPCRFFGDLMAHIQEGQNSRDSEVEAAINGHLQEAVAAAALMPNENGKCDEIVTVFPRAPDEIVTVFPRAPEEVVTVIPRAPEETAAEEEAALAVNTTADDVSADERTLSLSVELAAVNQAIMSLTGQQPLAKPDPLTKSTC